MMGLSLVLQGDAQEMRTPGYGADSDGRKGGDARLSKIPVLAFDVPEDAEYDGIRAELEAAGQAVGQMTSYTKSR
jgi:hypothetical protein